MAFTALLCIMLGVETKALDIYPCSSTVLQFVLMKNLNGCLSSWRANWPSLSFDLSI